MKTLRRAVYTSILTFLPFVTQASTIASSMVPITESAQSFSTTIGVPQPYFGVTLDVIAKGDYGKQRGETFVFKLDDSEILNWQWDTGPQTIENYEDFDYTLSGTVFIDQTIWDAVATDGMVNISWINGERSEERRVGKEC